LGSNELIGGFSLNNSNLRELYLDHNHLTSFETASASTVLALERIDLSYNQIQGSGPSSLFSVSPGLQTFIASVNCLAKASLLPRDLCAASNMTMLVLDGATSACRPPWKLLASVTRDSSGTRTIPDCLGSLANLETLHLAGNGLGGALPPLFAALSSDVSLSHNALTGPISANYLQSPRMRRLDLSYNRLSGKLGGVSRSLLDESDSAFSIAVNRISGPLPPSLLTSSQSSSNGSSGPLLSVLEGNLFDCNPLAPPDSVLPTSDAYLSQYQCGSYAFD